MVYLWGNIKIEIGIKNTSMKNKWSIFYNIIMKKFIDLGVRNNGESKNI